jgi:hypothetical protein
MIAKLIRSIPDLVLRPVVIDIAGLECTGIVTRENEDGSVQVHAFHPSGVVVHDGVTLIEDRGRVPSTLAESGDDADGKPPVLNLELGGEEATQ